MLLTRDSGLRQVNLYRYTNHTMKNKARSANAPTLKNRLIMPTIFVARCCCESLISSKSQRPQIAYLCIFGEIEVCDHRMCDLRCFIACEAPRILLQFGRPSAAAVEAYKETEVGNNIIQDAEHIQNAVSPWANTDNSTMRRFIPGGPERSHRTYGVHRGCA